MDPSNMKQAFGTDSVQTNRPEPNAQEIHLPAEVLHEMIAYYSTRQLYTLTLLSRSVFTYALENPQRLEEMKERVLKEVTDKHTYETEKMHKQHHDEAEAMRKRHHEAAEAMRKKHREELIETFKSL